jgi:TPR repeat protein
VRWYRAAAEQGNANAQTKLEILLKANPTLQQQPSSSPIATQLAQPTSNSTQSNISAPSLYASSSAFFSDSSSSTTTSSDAKTKAPIVLDEKKRQQLMPLQEAQTKQTSVSMSRDTS